MWCYCNALPVGVYLTLAWTLWKRKIKPGWVTIVYPTYILGYLQKPGSASLYLLAANKGCITRKAQINFKLHEFNSPCCLKQWNSNNPKGLGLRRLIKYISLFLSNAGKERICENGLSQQLKCIQQITAPQIPLILVVLVNSKWVCNYLCVRDLLQVTINQPLLRMQWYKQQNWDW